MTLYTNDNTVWKVNDPHVNDGGIVKPVNTGYVNENGIWKEMYESGPPTVIGEFSQGGYYFGEFGGHHLLCAPEDLNSIYFCNVNTKPNVGSSRTDGKTNTAQWYALNSYSPTEIVYQAVNYAKSWDYAQTTQYPDWYLPAIDELGLLFTNKDALYSAGRDTFSPGYFWSSTQLYYSSSPQTSVRAMASNGAETTKAKSTLYNIVAIRRWTPEIKDKKCI